MRVPRPRPSLCKCSSRVGCPPGLPALATNDLEQFRGENFLTQSAQRHGGHRGEGGGLRHRGWAWNLFERLASGGPGCVGWLFFCVKNKWQKQIPRSGSTFFTRRKLDFVCREKHIM